MYNYAALMEINNMSEEFPVALSLDVIFDEIEDRIILDAYTQVNGIIRMHLTRRMVLVTLDFYQAEVLDKAVILEASPKNDELGNFSSKANKRDKKESKGASCPKDSHPILITQAHLKNDKTEITLAFSGYKSRSGKTETTPAIALKLCPAEALKFLSVIVSKAVKANWIQGDRYPWLSESEGVRVIN